MDGNGAPGFKSPEKIRFSSSTARRFVAGSPVRYRVMLHPPPRVVFFQKNNITTPRKYKEKDMKKSNSSKQFPKAPLFH